MPVGVWIRYSPAMLNFENNEWRFDTPGPIASGVSLAFLDMINRIAGQVDRKFALEIFKEHFAAAAGETFSPSSTEGWAAKDLEETMDRAASNAPMFIGAFCAACQGLRARSQDPKLALPDANRINRILAEHGAGFEIQGNNLVASRQHRPIVVPERAPSLDEQAEELVHRSLATAERALGEGNGRQAVQELLWLLETIMTAFRGPSGAEGSIQGKYFSKILAELQRNSRGSHQAQILDWMKTLYGFLSSPAGGGIRHGLDLAEGVPVPINESRLYCNLIRSYITYLIEEHQRLKR